MQSADKLTTVRIKEALGDELSDEEIAQLKRFIEKTGNIESAKAALDLLTELERAA